MEDLAPVKKGEENVWAQQFVCHRCRSGSASSSRPGVAHSQAAPAHPEPRPLPTTHTQEEARRKQEELERILEENRRKVGRRSWQSSLMLSVPGCLSLGCAAPPACLPSFGWPFLSFESS